MTIIYWNIGERLTSIKKSLIQELISKNDINIICISEGSYSIEECTGLEDLFSSNSYKTYYSPKFSKEKNLGYGYIRNGLKIFYRNVVINDSFQFQFQREKGRIIKLVFDHNSKKYSLIFIHNFSKLGNREVTDQQRLFISTINQMLEFGEENKNDLIPIIIGDYNLEPWDNILRTQGYLKSSFLSKHHHLERRKRGNSNVFFNPITESIILDSNLNLGGTYYSDKTGWALYDFPIYDKSKANLEYIILTSIGSTELLTKNIEHHNGMVHNEIDHLPIQIKL